VTLDTLAREAHTEIRPLTRQIRRDIERHSNRRQFHDCARCGELIYLVTQGCLDNGRVSHRACAEDINRRVDEINEAATRDRLERAGLQLPPRS
jgi:hypothetical protein